MQTEITKTMTEFFTTVAGAYVDSTKKIYEANMALAAEMTRAITKATSFKK